MTRVITTSISDKTWQFLKDKGVGWSDAVEGYAAILMQSDVEDATKFIKDQSGRISKMQNTIAKISAQLIDAVGFEKYQEIQKKLT